MIDRITIPAPAKINLALHVTGQRADGYHLLDSLVAFTEAGDRITLETAETDGLTLSGPFAAALDAGADNLVLKARDGLRRLLAKPTPPVHIHLEKNLPIASGIGGGSADAAATIKGLLQYWKAGLPESVLQELALSLGADVPMCLISRPLIARGIGEELVPVTLPVMSILLVNPLVPVSTPAIFRRLVTKTNPPLPEGLLLLADHPPDLLKPLRNDLQPPAEALEPVIAMICERLRETGAIVSRMSGSGATCFGLYDNDAACKAAAASLRAAHPGWFICPTRTLP